MDPTANLSPAKSLWSPGAWKEFRAVGIPQSYPPGVSLFEQGSPVQATTLIDEGLVKLLRWERQGEAITVGIRFSGSSLGTAAAILGAPHVVTAETLTRCRVLSVPVERFLGLISANAQISADLHRIHAQELLDYIAHVGALGALSTKDRLLRLIGEVAAADKESTPDGPLRVVLPLRYTELAGAIVTTRQHLARVLKQLEKQDIVRRQKGHLVIPDGRKFWAAVNK